MSPAQTPGHEVWSSRRLSEPLLSGGRDRRSSGMASTSAPSSASSRRLQGSTAARARAKKLRAAQRRRRHGSEGPGKLRSLVVSPATLKKYRKAHFLVSSFAALVGLPWVADNLDRAIEQYIELLYDSGEAPSEARYALYGIAFCEDLPTRSPECPPFRREA